MKMNSPLGRSDLTPSYQHDLVVKMFNRTYVSILFPYIFTYFHMCSYISIYISHVFIHFYFFWHGLYIFIHTLHGLCIFHCFFTGKSHRGHQTRARAPARKQSGRITICFMMQGGPLLLGCPRKLHFLVLYISFPGYFLMYTWRIIPWYVVNNYGDRKSPISGVVGPLP